MSMGTADTQSGINSGDRRQAAGANPRDEIDAPKCGAGVRNSSPMRGFIRCVSEKYDAAFLLFLREWVGDDQNRIHNSAAD